MFFTAPNSQFGHLLKLPEATDIGGEVNNAMREVEKNNPYIAGVLPKSYNLFSSVLLKGLLKKISEIPVSLDFDAFGRIYEYFLGKFAMSEGQGEVNSTTLQHCSVATQVIELFHEEFLTLLVVLEGCLFSRPDLLRNIIQPAGTFYMWREKTDETGRLARLNLAIHGFEGDIRHGGNVNSHYDDPHDSIGAFDFVLANPPTMSMQ